VGFQSLAKVCPNAIDIRLIRNRTLGWENSNPGILIAAGLDFTPEHHKWMQSQKKFISERTGFRVRRNLEIL
jgi:hypothetical protein